MKTIVEKKILNLSIGELLASFSFIFCYISFNFTLGFVFKFRFVWVDHLTFLTLVVILWQGAFFWLCLYKKVKHRKNRIGAILFLRLLRSLDIIVIMANIYLIYRFAVHPIFNLFVLAFSLVEYINYFYVRLSYPLHGYIRRIRTSGFTKARMLREIA